MVRVKRASAARRTKRERGEPVSPFLEHEEFRRFERDYPQFRRRLIENRRGERHRVRASEALEKAVTAPFRAAERRGGGGFHCVVVEVADGDGMSWAATAAAQALRAAEAERDIDRCYLQGLAATHHPAITSLIGRRELAAAARKHGITESFGLLRPGIRGGVWAIVGLVVLATLAQSLAATWSTDGVSISALLSPQLLASVLIGSVGAIVYELLMARATHMDAPAMENLTEQFERSARSDRRAYNACVSALAQRLARGPFPRYLVVDDFGRLDTITASVLRRYASEHSGHGGGFELWVLFESADEREIWNTAASGASTGAFARARLYELEFLDEEDRGRLAEVDGAPQRAELLTVRAIRNSPASDSDDLRQFFVDHRAGNARSARYGSLELLYLLTLTASWGRSPTVSEKDLKTTLADPNHQLVRSQPLAAFLRGTALTRTEIAEQLASVRHDFARYITVSDPSGSSRQSQLVFTRQDLGPSMSALAPGLSLPSPALGHLFWALYWFDMRQGQEHEAFWAGRLALHVKNSAPHALDFDLGDQQINKLIDAAAFAVKGCLHTCVLGPVPDLLDAALALVDPRETGTLTDRAPEVLTLAWQAYAVLGDERILATIIEIESWNAPATHGRPSAPENPLERLFVESLNGFSATAVASWTDLISRSTREVAALRRYGRVRGAWFARALEPFTAHEEILVAAERAAYRELGELVDEALASIQGAEPGELLAVDFMSASLGLWSIALAFARGGLSPREGGVVDRLGTALDTAAETHGQAVSGRTFAADFVAEVLAKELMIFVAAVAELLSKVDQAGPEQERLVSLADNALGPFRGAGVPGTSRSRDVQHHLGLLEIAWRSLGLPQLAAYVGLRAGQFDLLWSSGASETYTDAYERLGSELQSPTHVGAIAAAVLAEATQGTEDLIGRLLWTGATIALKASFGPELTAEISIVAIHHARVYDSAFDPLLAHLVAGEPDGSRATALDSWLSGLADADVKEGCLDLLNCVGHSELPEVELSVIGALERRIASIESPEAAEGARQQIDVYRLKVELRSNEASVNVEQTVQAWRKRLRTDVYAEVLYYLATPTSPQLLLDEAVEVIRAKTDPADSSIFVHLAHWLVDQLPDGQNSQESDGHAVAVAFLERAMPRWARQLRMEETIAIYRSLYVKNSARRSEYGEQIVRWEAKRHLRDELEALPSLVEQGRFFMLFWHYFATLSWWGAVPIEAGPVTITQRLESLDESEALAVIREWQTAGGIVPAPFVGEPSALSRDFLVFGRLLFGALRNVDELSAARIQFNEVAHQAMPKLYRLLDVAEIPEPIREILVRHRRRFAASATPV